MSPRLKICCISSPAEVQLAVRYGAHALGFVGPMPSGPGTLQDEEIRALAAIVPPGVDSFLLSSRTTATALAEQIDYCGCSTIQIVTHIEPQELAALASARPAVRRVQVIHVEGPEALELIDAYEPFVHAFLLDSGRPNAATAELGGTGRTHDWTISKRFVGQTTRPVFLAGGLGPANVQDAISSVGAFGLDLCSGVRTEGQLDETKLAAYVTNATSLAAATSSKSQTSSPSPS